MAIVESQTLGGAVQFSGSPGNGLWTFNQYDNLPRTTGIRINTMSYCEELNGGPPITTEIAFFAFLLGSLSTTTMLWARDDAKTGDLLNPLTDNAARTFPGFRLPREAGKGGKFWSILLLSKDKSEPASGSISWYLVPAEDGT